MVVLLCVLSRTFKKAYLYIRIALYAVFFAQAIVQMMLGSTFEESVSIWLCELFLMLITAKKIENKEDVIEVQETQKEPIQEEAKEAEPVQDAKEDNQ